MNAEGLVRFRFYDRGGRHEITSFGGRRSGGRGGCRLRWRRRVRRAPARGADVRQRPRADRVLDEPGRLDQRRGLGRVDFDTDGDGKLDRIHVDFTLPKETADRRPEGPGHLRGQPVLRGHRATSRNWAVDHELGAAAGRARSRAVLQRRATRARRSARSTRSTWVPRGFARRALRVARHRPLRRLPDLRRAERDARRHGRHRLAQRPRARPTRPAPATIEVAGRPGRPARSAMMGTSYNGTIPIAAATTGVEGLEAIVPISAISDWYDYYRANGMVRAPHSAAGGTGNNRFHGEDLDVLADVVYSRIDEAAGPRTICRPMIDDIAAHAGPRHRQPQRVLGRAQLHEGRRERPRRDAARARQQRLQRHDQERGAVLRRAQGAGRPAPVLLPPGRPRRRAAGRR